MWINQSPPIILPKAFDDISTTKLGEVLQRANVNRTHVNSFQILYNDMKFRNKIKNRISETITINTRLTSGMLPLISFKIYVEQHLKNGQENERGQVRR